jgi:biopolymer transport protein ExbB
MISSASGLIIGIIAYVGYRYLNSQIDKATHKMELSANDFIDILQEPTR